MKIVMTGGHHTSALPIIQLLRAYPDIELIWFGAVNSLKNDKNQGLEYKEITALGIPFLELKAGKFYKTYDLKRLARIPYGFFQAFGLLNKNKPDLIFSFGGYLAVPTVIAGWLLGIPSITHEQTVVSGWANQVVGKFAKKILITWPSSFKYFPKKKTVLTGIPARPQIFEQKSTSFVFENALPVIYLTGGKTGSHKLNMAVLKKMESILTKYNFIHQCGDYSETRDYVQLSNKYNELKDRAQGKYYLRNFVFNDEIGEAFGKADLVVSRSGAHIVNDIACLKKPCLLVPIPWVSHNEQFENALILKKAGIGEILEEKNLSGESLLENINNMFLNIDQYKNVEKFDFIKKDAAELIVNEILKFRT